MFFFLGSLLAAQESPYLIPQTVFVGDRARLVIPLGSDFSVLEPAVITKPEALPATPELVIHRIELERRNGPAVAEPARGGRPGTLRLLIDFTAFATGSVPLPGLELPAQGGTLVFSEGITIPIASLLTGDALVLAPPAPPLGVPGTGLLVYGTTGTLFLLILLGIGLRIWGRPRLRLWAAGLRRRRLARGMERMLTALRNSLPEPSPEGAREAEALTTVAFGFRAFLTAITGVSCQGLSAGEFAGILPALRTEAEEPAVSGAVLCGIFRRCDSLRFSGTRIPHQELLSMLDEIQRVIAALYQREGSV